MSVVNRTQSKHSARWILSTARRLYEVLRMGEMEAREARQVGARGPKFLHTRKTVPGPEAGPLLSFHSPASATFRRI